MAKDSLFGGEKSPVPPPTAPKGGDNLEKGASTGFPRCQDPGYHPRYHEYYREPGQHRLNPVSTDDRSSLAATGDYSPRFQHSIGKDGSVDGRVSFLPLLPESTEKDGQNLYDRRDGRSLPGVCDLRRYLGA